MKLTALCLSLLLPACALAAPPEAAQINDDLPAASPMASSPTDRHVDARDGRCLRSSLEVDHERMARVERSARRRNTELLWVNPPTRRVCLQRDTGAAISARSAPPRTSRGV